MTTTRTIKTRWGSEYRLERLDGVIESILPGNALLNDTELEAIDGCYRFTWRMGKTPRWENFGVVTAGNRVGVISPSGWVNWAIYDDGAPALRLRRAIRHWLDDPQKWEDRSC